ncbi:unnamed protein product [Amoebophrya sp. A25]|nr:unnamed protein product [Amoebophrya sp. A25]|eukprot:GSA25T00005224001.1
MQERACKLYIQMNREDCKSKLVGRNSVASTFGELLHQQHGFSSSEGLPVGDSLDNVLKENSRLTDRCGMEKSTLVSGSFDQISKFSPQKRDADSDMLYRPDSSCGCLRFCMKSNDCVAWESKSDSGNKEVTCTLVRRKKDEKVDFQEKDNEGDGAKTLKWRADGMTSLRFFKVRLSDARRGATIPHRIKYVPGNNFSPMQCGRVCALMETVCEGFIVGAPKISGTGDDNSFWFLLRGLGDDRLGPKPGNPTEFVHREDKSSKAGFFRLTAGTKDGKEKCVEKFRIAWV